MPHWLRLTGIAKGSDAALLLMRLYLGGFLIWGVWDNIVSAERMAEFEGFLTRLNCPMPGLAAPVSVWAQLAIGVLLIPGFLTRWAGLLLAVNFVVAIGLIGTAGGPGEALARDLFGPVMCVLAGLVFATQGPGGWSLDAWLDRRR